MKERVAMRSKLEGFNQSRLPEFSEEEIQLIKGTHDYFALNHYSTSMVTAIKERAIGSPHFNNDISTSVWKKKEWPMVARWFTVSIINLILLFGLLNQTCRLFHGVSENI